MAAFDTPWMMTSTPSSSRRHNGHDAESQASLDPHPPTVAAFSPVTLSHASTANKQRSTILVHQKSPLLIATPPQITRALAYSHPFLLPLNKLAGLLTWTSGDPWESFLLVAGFWAVVLYGDTLMRYAGPVVVVIGLILGMYSRRYSPLSSTGWTAEKLKKGHKREQSEATNTKHQKTLDEIVETLKIFTSRCNVLLDPLLELTDFLSTQRTATSATTRPALTTLLIRILLVTPLWIVLTLRPIQIITTKRMALVAGTLFLTWHSRPTRVSRTIVWRSASVRRFCTIITGLHFTDTLSPAPDSEGMPTLPPRTPSAYQERAQLAASAAAKRRPDAPGVKFTFILYENQRRWVGLGWTTSLFAYERAAWTDEHLNPAPAKSDFELPDVEEGTARWRWVERSKWRVEGAAEKDEGGSKASEDASDGGSGWIYYDNKWQTGRRGQDGWGRYTRRRKWYRDAELVEVSPSTEITPSPTPLAISPSRSTQAVSSPLSLPTDLPPDYAEKASLASDNASISSKMSNSSRFRPTLRRRWGTGNRDTSRTSSVSFGGSDDDRPIRANEADWGIGDDARMGLE
ncbi:integral peroxisomal membrane peroxin-domain-containing protein [Amylocarpus encephaloides]|uniref:Integral peroxisomal membrane peroxin-domain-containing protein n=1 Tax=Amylocarpus encephaloides TaxID=45428 RepID=A0A9P7YSD3_9HELO|nr:integral peroxisomal membrane peroxin-domain-containing protein [Amylocarpus encephaloides]